MASESDPRTASSAGSARPWLLTGSTGFLGSHFLLRALPTGRPVHALVRGETEPAARTRLRRRLDVCAASYSLPVLQDDWDRNVSVHLGDLATDGCGLSETSLAELERRGFSDFWHFAASLNFEERRREKILRQNVEGTRNALALARMLGVSRFLYVSTAYTVGLTEPGPVPEELHSLDRRFNNLYEESKCSAEHLVTEYCGRHGMDYRILRPGIVVGPSGSFRTGGSDSGVYGLMRTLHRLSDALAELDHDLTILGDPRTPLHLIPVDHVNRDLLALVEAGFPGGPVYHLTAEGSIDAETLVATVCRHVGIRPIRVGTRDHEDSPLDRLLDRRTTFYGSYFRVWHSFDRSLPGSSHVSVEDLDLLCLHYAQELRDESSDSIFERSVVRSPDGTALNVYSTGDADQPTVLLVNAYGMPVEFMIPLARRLSDRHRVITWESRGVPNLDLPFDPERSDLGWHVRDALAVLDAARAGSAHVVGWCTGAQLALRMAHTAAERTRTLVLLNGSYVSLPEAVAPRTDFYRNMAKVMPKIAKGRSDAETYHRLIYGNRAQQSYKSFARASEKEERRTLTNLLEDTDPVLLNMTSVPFRTPEALYRYACMVTRLFAEPDDAWATAIGQRALCVTGDRDTIAHPASTREIGRRLAASETVTIKDGDHFSHYNDEELGRVVADFLASADA